MATAKERTISEASQEALEAALRYFLRKYKYTCPDIVELIDLANVIVGMQGNPTLKTQEKHIQEGLNLANNFVVKFPLSTEVTNDWLKANRILEDWLKASRILEDEHKFLGA